ncbi:MAG: GrpB family protein [Planctomycetota bacterium]
MTHASSGSSGRRSRSWRLDPAWPAAFAEEEERLRAWLPADLVGRIEHFGSTAVPGLAAKPIIDVLVEVGDLGATRDRIAPLLEARGYEYLWRPTRGDDGEPFYAWFIRRDPVSGRRTHHLHVVEPGMTEHWDRLRFRDALRADPGLARDYEALKRRLAADHPRDRVAYTEGKAAFIERATRQTRAEERER